MSGENITVDVVTQSTVRTYADLVFDEVNKQYLIRVDGEVLGLLPTEEAAIRAINSIALHEEKERQKPNVTVYRQNLNDGKEVVISTKTQGWIRNGPLTREMHIDMLAVPRLVQMSPYAEKIAQYKANKENK